MFSLGYRNLVTSTLYGSLNSFELLLLQTSLVVKGFNGEGVEVPLVP